jgi:transposase
VPTPTKLREAVIRAFHDQGLTYEQIADLLGIGRATVNRVLRRYREAGTVEPKPRGGGNASKIRGAAALKLEGLVAAHPDMTVAELAREFHKKTGIRASRSAVYRALVRLGYTLKKRRLSRWSATRPRT